jgi:hypothetical protein
VACALLIGVANAVVGLARPALITKVIAPSFRAQRRQIGRPLG